MSFNYVTKENKLNNFFYKIPKQFMIEEKYKKMKDSAKVLYSILYEKTNFSIENNLVDDKNRVYIICTFDEIQDLLGYSRDKVNSSLKDLEKFNLIKKDKIKCRNGDLVNVLYIAHVEITNDISKTNKEKQHSDYYFYKEKYMNKLKDYLNPKLEDIRNKQADFFEKTNMASFIGNSVFVIDYKIYSECLEVYTNTGVNYYDDYISLMYVIQIYKLYTGIRDKDPRHFHLPCFESYEVYNQSLRECIESYKFFDIVECCGINIKVFEELLTNSEMDWNYYTNKELMQKDKNNKEYINKLNESYLNFNNFNESKLQELYSKYKEYTKPSNRYSVKELMDMNIELYEGNICLIFGFLGDEIQFVGKTTRIFNYIYNKNKEYKIDNVAIFMVEEKYIEDLYIELIVKGDIKSHSNTINYKCMKYVSYNKAKNYYKAIYGFSAWDLKRIIKKDNIELLEISGGTRIINKIKLHDAIKKEVK